MKTIVYSDEAEDDVMKSGGGGIRTPGIVRFNGFRDRPIRPLWHTSGWLFGTCYEGENKLYLGACK